jgi:hypothetical protein
MKTCIVAMLLAATGTAADPIERVVADVSPERIEANIRKLARRGRPTANRISPATASSGARPPRPTGNSSATSAT